MKSCPQCNTKCLNSAVTCDCGYSFDPNGGGVSPRALDTQPPITTISQPVQPVPTSAPQASTDELPRHIRLAIAACVLLTIAQVVLIFLGGGPKVESVLSPAEGQMYRAVQPYSGGLAAVWILSVAATAWLTFRHRQRAFGVIVVTLSPILYFALLALLYSPRLGGAAIWHFQLRTGSVGYFTSFSNLLDRSGIHGGMQFFLDPTNPTPVGAGLFLGIVALCAYAFAERRSPQSNS